MVWTDAKPEASYGRAVVIGVGGRGRARACVVAMAHGVPGITTTGRSRVDAIVAVHGYENPLRERRGAGVLVMRVVNE